MKVLALFLGVLLPTIYSQTTTLEYPTDITSFSFTWGNPDWTTSTLSGPLDGTIITDGDYYTGEQLDNPSTETGSWGKSPSVQSSTQGMTGTFYADTLSPGTGYSHWSITEAKVTLGGDGCFTDSAVAAFYYQDLNGNEVVNTYAVEMTEGAAGDASQNYIVPYTFSVTLPAAVATNGAIGFSIATNSYCEGILRVLEFELVGTAIMTDEPTKSPSPEPTTSPTTATPTMAPTVDCSGEVTWGDPHFRMVSFDNNQVPQFNYQGLGWYYYIFPCDMDDYEGWPFFLQSEHTRCYWRGNPKGCITLNRLILNTKPDPWVIEFTGQGISEFIVGTDAAGQTASDFDLDVTYTESNPLIIEYDDGQTNAQYGTMKIFYTSSRRGTIVIQLNNVGFNAYPRTCNQGELSGLDCGDYECENQVIDIRNSGTYTWYSCPTCLRNIACGIMGRYIRGDCTNDMLADPDSDCYDILQGSDGTLYQPPKGDSIFEPFADSWHEDVVNALIEAEGYSVLYTNKKMHFSLKAAQAARKEKHNVLDGRDLNFDSSRLDGDCLNNPTRVAEVNETCRLNTVVKYAKCCKEIGFCDIFWNACVEDLCSCYDITDPNKPDNITEQWCLDTIVHQSMNTTCSIEALYPTATPTAAPTPAPVGIVNSLPKGQKAEDLIWLYLIFVAIFILIAAGAYWYYRKKNVGVGSGRATFDDNIEAPSIN